MSLLTLKVVNFAGEIRAMHQAAENVSLIYEGSYAPEDRIVLETDTPAQFCVIHLEDTLAPSLVYLVGQTLAYSIPYGDDRLVFSPKSFTGERHLLRARLATAQEVTARRCLSHNPYDRHDNNCFFPHASANVETRGEAVFAAYNAIDGIFENSDHGKWPYQSWGINRNPSAELRIDFGRLVCVDEIRLTLRADFPHDNYWEHVTAAFSDGSEEHFSLIKTNQPQRFVISERKIAWLVLKQLIPSDDPSPFPALTQIEMYGRES